MISKSHCILRMVHISDLMYEVVELMVCTRLCLCMYVYVLMCMYLCVCTCTCEYPGNPL